MANSIIPDEGRDYLLGIFPKAGANPTNLYLGLFTSQTASTVPANTAVLATPSGVTEAAYPGYQRVAVASTDWGAAADQQTIWTINASAVTAAQKSFPAATGTYNTAINGFFLATASTAGIAIYYANFDDQTAIASMALGDVIKLTPKFGIGG